MTTLEKSITHQQQLNKELREFLEWNIGNLIYRPSADETNAAVSPQFPELVQKYQYIDEILDECGIVAISDIGSKKYGTHMRLSYSVADTDENAQEQLQKYSQPIYKKIRQALEIDHLWILKVEPDFWGYDPDALCEASLVFAHDLGKPECCIIEL